MTIEERVRRLEIAVLELSAINAANRAASLSDLTKYRAECDVIMGRRRSEQTQTEKGEG